MDIDKKRENEKEIVKKMIEIYCCKKHHTSGEICKSCDELWRYAARSTDRCPFMETKSFCSNCKRPCYSEEMLKRMREVMRYSGPRMLFYYPLEVIRHLLQSRKKFRR